jgi:hypothetical protein
MKNNFTLNIQQPCAEKWTTTSHGGFCSTCQKVVKDFTTMSDAEILEYFGQQTARVCGSLRADQLKAYHHIPSSLGSIKPGWRLVKAGMVALAVMAGSHTALAQSSEQTKTVQSQNGTPAQTAVLSAAKVTVKGEVKSAEDGSALPSVNVYRKGSVNEGTVTDSQGRFEYPKQLSAGEVLIFSFIGLARNEYVVPNDYRENTAINMSLDMTMMPELITGEIIVSNVDGTEGRKSGFRQRIKKFFH